MSLSREELLDLLVEEAAEVIQAVQKIKRFGWSHDEPGYGVNCDVLAKELGDFLGIFDAIAPDVSSILVERARGNKIERVERWKNIVLARKNKNA